MKWALALLAACGGGGMGLAPGGDDAPAAADARPADGPALDTGMPDAPMIGGTDLQVVPATINFGVTGAAQSPSAVVTFTNVTIANMPVISTALVGADPSLFAITDDQCAGTTLALGASCTISIAYAPGSNPGVHAVGLIASAGAVTTTAALLGACCMPPGVVTPASADFGLLPIGTTSSPFEFTITNDESLPVSMSTPTIGGASAARFSIASTSCGATLGAGASCTVDVRFVASATGDTAATLNATLDGQLIHATLLGEVTTGATNVTISPPIIDFGIVASGDHPQATIVIKNPSTIETGKLVVSTVGMNPSAFYSPFDPSLHLPACTHALLPGDWCAFTISCWDNLAIGSYTADVTVDASWSGSANVVLMCVHPPGVVASSSPLAGNFPDQDVGTSSSYTDSITFTNDGSTIATLSPPMIGGADPAQWNIDSTTCTSSLAAGASCVAVVSFSPTLLGYHAATLTAKLGTALLTGHFAGTGTSPAPRLVADADRAFDGPVTVGSTASLTQSIDNYGHLPTGVLDVALTGDPSFSIASSTCTGTLSGSAYCDVVIDCAPSSSGTHTGILTASASPGGQTTTNLECVGSYLEVSPRNAQMGPGYDTTMFTITNHGSAPQTISEVALEGDTFHSFTLLPNGCMTTLAPGGTCSFDVKWQANPAVWSESAWVRVIADVDIVVGLSGSDYSGTPFPM